MQLSSTLNNQYNYHVYRSSFLFYQFKRVSKIVVNIHLLYEISENIVNRCEQLLPFVNKISVFPLKDWKPFPLSKSYL